MKIKIGSAEYTIKYTDKEHHNERRGCNYKELREIHINSSMNSNLQEITLIHEILHACADFVGMNDEKLTEEEWVTRMSPIIHLVLKENKNLF